MFEYSRNTASSRVTADRFARGEASHVMTVENELAQNERVGPAVIGLQTSLAGVAESLQKRGHLLSATGLTDAANAAIDSTVRPAYRTLTADTLKAQRALDVDLSDLMTPRFREDQPSSLRSEHRTHLRGQKLPDALAAAQSDLLGLGAAIIEGGQGLSGFPTDIFQRLQRDVAVEQLAQRIIQSTSMSTEPSLADPLGGQPDLETARKNAAARLDRLEAERALIGRVPALLGSTVTVVALMTDTSRQAALERLAA